jgi:uncharacterized membrane protein YdjX (TVP38/TMEM64 family)
VSQYRHLKGIFFVVIAFSLVISQIFFDIASYLSPEQIQLWLAEMGKIASLFYILAMAIAVVISPIPSLPMDIAAGAFFGPLLGTIYSVAGALAGAIISFILSRFLGREFIERFLGGHINFCTSCSDRLLTKIVFISRLLPIVSFDIISYGAGLTKMSLKKFVIATFFGMIPLTFIYNYFGSVLVFGKRLTLFLGIILVFLFFLIPRWLERRGVMKSITHRE